MSVHLNDKELTNSQQIEIAVNGPDGATHLLLCTGIANVISIGHETYFFFVGPQIARRQFVVAIVSGALSTIQSYGKRPPADNSDLELRVDLISINANYDDEFGRVKVRAEIATSIEKTKLAISYNVSILAELPTY
jgi:hypothetical protein